MKPLHRVALRDCRRWRSVDVFAIDVGGIGYEGGASVAVLSVALFEAKELDFLGDEVENIDHFGGEIVTGFEMWFQAVRNPREV
jgi:hypothetical protein